VKYCIVFPKVHFFEPIDLNGVIISYVGRYPRPFDEFELYFNEYLQEIFLRELGETCHNYSIAYFDSNESEDTILQEYYPYLLLLRFCILTDSIFTNYSSSEFIFISLTQMEDFNNDNVYYHQYINGIEFLSAFTLRQGICTTREHMPAHLSESRYPRLKSAYDMHPENVKIDITNSISRYIFANSPKRHIDEYSQIMNLVSGIESLLDLKPKQGNEEFGKQLSLLFQYDELGYWGEQVYKLANDFRHQNLSTVHFFDRNSTEWKKQFFKNRSESMPFMGHFIIAKRVLENMIMAKLTGSLPEQGWLMEYLISNETPIRQIIQLMDDKIPLGPPYYDLFEQVRLNVPGGSLIQMKRIVRFVCRSLFEKFPNEEFLNPETLAFNDSRSLIKRLESIRKWLSSMHNDKVISINNIDEIMYYDRCEHLIWNIQFPLLTECLKASNCK
jgi:hypothetical protein